MNFVLVAICTPCVLCAPVACPPIAEFPTFIKCDVTLQQIKKQKSNTIFACIPKQEDKPNDQ